MLPKSSAQQAPTHSLQAAPQAEQSSYSANTLCNRTGNYQPALLGVMSKTQILVPVDTAARTQPAVDLARTLAVALDAEIVLMSAVRDDAWPGRTREVASDLELAATPLRQATHAVETVVRLGDAAPAIVHFAANRPFDLVVMATHGRSGLTRALLGSVADRVVRDCPVPVALIRSDALVPQRLKTLLVPVDGTPGAALALGTAIPLAHASGARLILVRVAVPLPLWVHDPTLGLDTGLLIDPMWNEDARRSAEVYADGLAARLKRAKVQAEGRGLLGEPAATISALAREVEADLVVMSTHALVGAARSLLGSAANGVVRQSGRPVLLVRRGGSVGPAGDPNDFSVVVHKH